MSQILICVMAHPTNQFFRNYEKVLGNLRTHFLFGLILKKMNQTTVSQMFTLG